MAEGDSGRGDRKTRTYETVFKKLIDKDWGTEL